MKHYVGLDVSVKETAVCVIDDEGIVVWKGKAQSTPAAIAKTLFEKAPALNTVCMETGPLAVPLWHGLRDLGIEVICIHARQAATALKLQTNKTDQNDAAGLAHLVRSGWFTEVKLKSMETYKIRALLIARDQLVGYCTGLINKIRGLTRTFGLSLGAGKGGTFDRKVRECLPDDPFIRHLFESLLDTLKALREKRRDFGLQLTQMARRCPVSRLLMTMPGVGPITALSFISTIEDPKRFRRSSDVGAYLGLTPKRYQSGEVDIGGRISKCGDRLTRKLLFEAANVMLYRSSPTLHLRRWAEGIARRSGSWKARVALARKLSTILFRMWVDGKPFDRKDVVI